jgi:CheY-like chemotaxis protein
MKELTEWLIRVERMAGDFYSTAARVFTKDQRLTAFLKHLAEEEAWHERVMNGVTEYVDKNPGVVAAFELDDSIRDKIETSFYDCEKRLKLGMLTREHVVNCIATAEFSEWNDIFIYVINTLRDAGREFAYTAVQMQAHKNHVEEFIKTFPEGNVYLATLRRLPPVWNTRILIVENHAGVLDLLNAVLSGEVSIDAAANGKEGLEKVKGFFFDVVITDLNMPVMDGIDFYKEASRFDPRIADRFLFLAGLPDDRAVEFFKLHRLPYLTKPMRISEITKAVKEIRDLHARSTSPS